MHAPAQSGGDVHGVFLVDAVEHGDELFATVAAEHVRGPQLGAQRAGHGDEGAIAGGVALAIVQFLEVVQVEEEQGVRLVVIALQHVACGFAPGPPVQHACQRVIIGEDQGMVAVATDRQRAIGQADREHDRLESAGGERHVG